MKVFLKLQVFLTQLEIIFIYFEYLPAGVSMAVTGLRLMEGVTGVAYTTRII